MDEQNQQFISQQFERPPEKSRKKFQFLFLLSISSLLIIGFFIFANKTSSTNENSKKDDEKSESWTAKIPFLKPVKDFIAKQEIVLNGEDNDRINILFLGIGGKNHDGAYLTDTIILASIQPSTKKIAFTSIPRDLYVTTEDGFGRKINSINSNAELKEPGSGSLVTKNFIENTLGIPVQYFVKIDFEGFEKIIDNFGGIEVEVDKTFDDYDYPALGQENAEPYESRFEHLHFNKGPQIMDGILALKYARSRHGTNGEGSDFARAKRQQKIILALKEKIVSNSLFKPSAITKSLSDLNEHIETNFQILEIIKLWKDYKDIKPESINSKNLDNGPDGLLADLITHEGAYVLVPRSGDFSEIRFMLQNIFNDQEFEFKSKIGSEKPVIDIRNGTMINGLASNTSLMLKKYNFEVVKIGNASQRDFTKSTIYDLTYGEKLESLKILKNLTNASVSYGLPQWLSDEIVQETKQPDFEQKQPDFILIIGDNKSN